MNIINLFPTPVYEKYLEPLSKTTIQKSLHMKQNQIGSLKFYKVKILMS